MRSAFDKYEKGLTKYFKHYCRQAKLELGVDPAFRMENMHYKEFVKFGYQTKIVPMLATSEDVSNTFRNVAKYQ